MSRETVAAKANRYLIEGRIVVAEVSRRGVTATVRGEGSLYATSWRSGEWSCDCPHQARTTDCCHVMALKRIIAVDLHEEEANR